MYSDTQQIKTSEESHAPLDEMSDEALDDLISTGSDGSPGVWDETCGAPID